MSLHVHKLDRRHGPAGSFSARRYVPRHVSFSHMDLCRLARTGCCAGCRATIGIVKNKDQS